MANKRKSMTGDDQIDHCIELFQEMELGLWSEGVEPGAYIAAMCAVLSEYLAQQDDAFLEAFIVQLRTSCEQVRQHRAGPRALASKLM